MNSLLPPTLLEHLSRYDLSFAVIGGMAVIAHGVVRSTEDLDIVLLRTDESERVLLGALSAVNAIWLSDSIDPGTGLERPIPVSREFIRSHHLMALETDLGYLDIFTFVPGLPDASVADLIREAVDIGGIHFASVDWLRRLKRASGRPRDLEDLRLLDQTDS